MPFQGIIQGISAGQLSLVESIALASPVLDELFRVMTWQYQG